MVYGTMGGDGQPQTQAAVFSRAIWFGQPLQQAVTAPRWLLGHTWGQDSDTLKPEGRIPDAAVADLRRRGHDIEMLGDYDETVGHAGAIARHAEAFWRARLIRARMAAWPDTSGRSPKRAHRTGRNCKNEPPKRFCM
jgi:gamma-glutamyltranspeptidase